jgi:hypothetical protein
VIHPDLCPYCRAPISATQRQRINDDRGGSVTSFDELFDAIHDPEEVEHGETHRHTITPAPPTRREQRVARLRLLWWRATGRVRRTPNGWRIRP